MSDDLEALAAKGRARETERGDASGDDAEQPDYRRYYGDQTIRHTFRAVHRTGQIPLAVAAVLIGAAIAAGVIAKLAPVGYVMGGGAVALLALAVVWIVLGKRAETAGHDWIRALPFRFNADDYLEALAGMRMNSAVELSVTFSDPPTDADRELYGSACAGAVDLESRSWKPHTLSLRSGKMSTYYPAQNGNESYFTNALVHAWVKALIDRVLRPLHDRGLITSVRVAVS